MGTSPTGVTVVFRCDVGICDRFMFVGLRDPEICGAFAQIKGMQQIAVVYHAMVNVADAGSKSEDEYFGTATDGKPFGTVNGMDANEYNTDTSQHMGAVSLINTIRKQFKGLTGIQL